MFLGLEEGIARDEWLRGRLLSGGKKIPRVIRNFRGGGGCGVVLLAMVHGRAGKILF